MAGDDDLEIPGFLKRAQPTTAEDIVEALDGQPETMTDDLDALLQAGVDDEVEEEAPKPAKRGRKAKQKDAPENDRAVEGHNSRAGGIAGEQLKTIVERIERMQEEIDALSEDKKEIYIEAKANGFDAATIRKVVSLRKQDTAERQEKEALLDLYMHALGMV